jgi:predicted nucleic acid-binding protein
VPAEIAYLDSSALVKLAVREPESTALRRFLRRVPAHASSALAVTEVLRAVRRSDAAATPRARIVLRQVVIIDLMRGVLIDAGLLDPPELRTLDAVHLAAARALGDDLVAVVTYDQRMAAAATRLGFPVQAPV